MFGIIEIRKDNRDMALINIKHVYKTRGVMLKFDFVGFTEQEKEEFKSLIKYE